jgi:hypothetical protein
MISEETQEPQYEPSTQDASPKVVTQPSEDQKREIASWVSDGMGLSDIQKKINLDFAVVMTYMDVRFLVDDLNLTLVDEEEETVAEDTSASDAPSGTAPISGENPTAGGGGVKVELNTVNPPGSMASGSVVFSDGERKTWMVDQTGRLGLSGGKEDYNPSEEDIVEFQKELDLALRGKGI